MNRKKSLVLVLFMVMVLVLTSCMLVACNSAEEPAEQETETTEIEATEGLVISNSDFKVVSSTKEYPSSATDWTGAKLYSSGSYPDAVTAGVINLEKSVYDANKATWKDEDDTLYNALTAGGRFGTEDEIKNALLIYMPESKDGEDTTHGPTAYGYTSSSFSLEKASYYKFSVDVLTKDIKGDEGKAQVEPGARIYISSNTYAEFDKINTNGEWKTYTVYFESNPVSATSLTVNLSLGKYTSAYSYGLTTGYAVFDNITLEKCEKSAYDEAKASEVYGSETRTNTLKLVNGNFDFGTTSLGTTSAPSNWSVVTGNSAKDDPAPTSKGYNAIIDVSKFDDNYDSYSSTYYLKSDLEKASEAYVFAKNLEAIKGEEGIRKLPDNTLGTNIYMLSQQLMTAQGLKSSKPITIEKNKTYKISVNVYTYNIFGAGVSLILSGNDTKDIVISGISANKSSSVYIGNAEIDTDAEAKSKIKAENVTGATTGEWKTYSFYITGNQYYNYSYTLTLWLGTDGANSNNKIEYTKYSSSAESTDTTYDANGTFSNGWAFFDDVRLEESPEEPVDVAVIPAGAEMKFDASSDLTKTGIKVELSTTNEFAAVNTLEGTTVTSPTTTGNTVTALGIPEGWACTYDFEDAKAPIISGLITEGIVDLESEGTFTSSFSGDAVSAYPAMPYAMANTKAFVIGASKDSFYQVESLDFVIEKNTTYRLSAWVKTVDVKKSSGASISLLKKTDGDKYQSVLSVTNVNTNEFDETTNDWCEVTFYLCGNDKEDVTMHLVFSLGSGTRWSADTLTTGAAYFANLNLAKINFSAFSGATSGTYTKISDLSESFTYSFSNGSFDEYDKDADDIDGNKSLSEQEVAGDPEHWTFSDDTKKGAELVAGVIALDPDTNPAYAGYEGLYFVGSAQTTALLPSIDFSTIYGDKASADYLLSENLAKIAGPYILAISDKGSADGFAVGYASDTFSLSANTIYKLTVDVKTFGTTTASVFLTGDSSGTDSDNYFQIDNTADTDWVTYTYFITVGQSSVSPKLNLWLGTDDKYVTKVASKGTVLFDNVTLNSISKDDIPETLADTEKSISFTVDGFDSLASSISARSTLSSPNNWSGAVDTDQTSSNTKSGVIYVDDNYLETTDGYVSILGKSFDLAKYTATDEELQAAKASGDEKYIGLSDGEITELIKKDKYEADRAAALMSYAELSAIGTKSGKQMLVINNIEKSAYIYSRTALTLSSEKCYKISVFVRTAKLNDSDEAGAYIELNLGDANDATKPFIFKAIKADEWTEYSFYVKTLEDSVSNVVLKLALGKYYDQEEGTDIPSLTSGYAFFDNIAIEEIDESVYDSQTESNVLLKRTVEVEEKGTADDDNDDPGETQKPKFNTEYLYWMVPTIVLGLLIIVVVVVWVVKKIKAKQPKKEKAEDEGEKISTESIDEIRSKYDSNKE